MATEKNISENFERSVTVLEKIYGKREAMSMTRIIFEDVFGIKETNGDTGFSDEDQAKLQEILNRLIEKEPLQYILGFADFYGWKFKVNPAVLIPRPETEELVYWVHNFLKKNDFPDQVKAIDIGTGSGCIAVSLKKLNPNLEMHALDKGLEALEIAKENAKINNVEINFILTDFLDPGKREELGEYDLIISNPPYIPYIEKDLMPENVLKHEPEMALFVENESPLLFYDKIADFAINNGKGHTALFFELNEYNATQVFDLLKNKGFKDIQIEKDLQGKDRMLFARINS